MARFDPVLKHLKSAGAQPDQWNWSLSRGRWQPEFGLPRTPAMVELSADMAPGRRRYDFWREMVFYHFDADPLELGRNQLFEARGLCTTSARMDFYFWESDAMSGRRTPAQITRDGGDTVSIGFVLAGERAARDADDTAWRSRPGDLFVYDSARASNIAWTRHRGVYLGLRRPTIVAALGTDVPSPAILRTMLSSDPLAPVLRDQLVATGLAMPGLDEAQRTFAMDHAASMAEFILRRAAARPLDEDRPGRSGLYNAAVELIERNLASTALTPARIAAALGCSRRTLYRAFAEHDQSVATAIRDRRFNKTRDLLLTTNDAASIAEVAARCGLYDSANFSTAFRRRFGCSPSEARRG